MATGAPEAMFVVHGPIGHGDLPGLCERVCRLLAGSSGPVICEVGTVDPDAVTVDALARLQLAARRCGRRVLLRNASPDLLELVRFMGLTDVLPEQPMSSGAEGSLVVE